MTTPDERHITEAEYAAWVERRMRSYLDELNERFAGVLPAGVRFEWQAMTAPDISSPLKELYRREVVHDGPPGIDCYWPTEDAEDQP